MNTLLGTIGTLNHVVKVDYLQQDMLQGMYIETDVTKLPIAEKILDDVITLFGDRSEKYHFGIKTQKELFPETIGNFYCIYIESLEEFKKRS